MTAVVAPKPRRLQRGRKGIEETCLRTQGREAGMNDVRLAFYLGLAHMGACGSTRRTTKIRSGRIGDTFFLFK
jgi:hypothetical protein